MRFPRPIDATLHGVTDYTAGATLVTVLPRLAELPNRRIYDGEPAVTPAVVVA